MELSGLRAFVEVADAGSVREASRRLGYSQSAVSRHVTGFERSVGGPVFLRDRAGMRLTGLGRRLYPTARAVVETLDAMRANGDTAARGPVAAPKAHAAPTTRAAAHQRAAVWARCRLTTG